MIFALGPGPGPCLHTSHPLSLKSSKFEGLIFFKPLWRTVVASGGSKSSNIEDLGFVKPLLTGVVASSGSKSLKLKILVFLRRCLWRVEILNIEGRGLFKPLWRIVVASHFQILFFLTSTGGPSTPPASRNLQHLKILDLLSFFGGSSSPPARRNPQELKIWDF